MPESWWFYHVLPIATGKLKHAFQIGGPWIDRGFMLNPPNLWHSYGHPTAARPTGLELRIASGTPGRSVSTHINTTALCHPHPRTRWPIISTISEFNYMRIIIGHRSRLYGWYMWDDIWWTIISGQFSGQMIRSEHPFWWCSKMSVPRHVHCQKKPPKAQSISSSPWQKRHLKHNAKKNASLISVNWINPPRRTYVSPRICRERHERRELCSFVTSPEMEWNCLKCNLVARKSCHLQRQQLLQPTLASWALQQATAKTRVSHLSDQAEGPKACKIRQNLTS